MNKFETYVEGLEKVLKLGNEFMEIAREYGKIYDSLSPEEIEDFEERFTSDEKLSELSDNLNKLWKTFEDEL